PELPPAPCDRDPSRRLRIGYLSPDFRVHSVAYFLRPILAAHDKGAVEVHAFSNVQAPDDVTRELRGLCDMWHDVSGLDDQCVAAAIRDADIDVLVDLAGHTRNGRPGVLVHAPAPVQMTYLGYPNTTGVSTVKYRITDAVADPVGHHEDCYTETLLRVPGCFLSYTPPANAPAVDKRERCGVVFGSFNELLKLTPRMLSVWCEILQAEPTAILMLKNAALSDAGTRRRLVERFQREGINESRLTLLGRTITTNAHLALYNDVDIALDTHPYNGTTTTCEALWMGTPVITLCEGPHAGRVSASILHALSLDSWVTLSPQEYVACALALARAPDELERVSATLREQVARAPAFAPERMARALESEIRQVWRHLCEQ
ncbi:MAG: protein O-GlcNAc transferase, partial [Gammaproteobacteria bacterium]